MSWSLLLTYIQYFMFDPLEITSDKENVYGLNMYAVLVSNILFCNPL